MNAVPNLSHPTTEQPPPTGRHLLWSRPLRNERSAEQLARALLHDPAAGPQGRLPARPQAPCSAARLVLTRRGCSPRKLLTYYLAAQFSDPKHRKTLADRAGEYPTKNATAATSGLARSTSVKGHTLASVGFHSPLPSTPHAPSRLGRLRWSYACPDPSHKSMFCELPTGYACIFAVPREGSGVPSHAPHRGWRRCRDCCAPFLSTGTVPIVFRTAATNLRRHVPTLKLRQGLQLLLRRTSAAPPEDSNFGSACRALEALPGEFSYGWTRTCSKGPANRASQTSQTTPGTRTICFLYRRLLVLGRSACTMLTRSSSRTLRTSPDRIRHQQLHDITPAPTSPPASAPAGMNGQSHRWPTPGRLTHSRFPDIRGPEPKTR